MTSKSTSISSTNSRRLVDEHLVDDRATYRRLFLSNVMLLVGRIGKPHGVRGDVFVSFSSDRPERRQPGAMLLARTVARLGEPDLEVVIESCRPQSDRHVVHFAGFDTRGDAEKLVNAELYAEAIDDADALWVHQLIGSTVVTTDGMVVGTCVSVIDNPAHAIVELDSGVLVPVPFVVSCVDGTTTIDPPPGLLDESGETDEGR